MASVGCYEHLRKSPRSLNSHGLLGTAGERRMLMFRLGLSVWVVFAPTGALAQGDGETDQAAVAEAQEWLATDPANADESWIEVHNASPRRGIVVGIGGGPSWILDGKLYGDLPVETDSPATRPSVHARVGFLGGPIEIGLHYHFNSPEQTAINPEAAPLSYPTARMFASSVGLGMRTWIFNRSSTPPVGFEVTPSVGVDGGFTFWRSDFVVSESGTPGRLRAAPGAYVRADLSVTMWEFVNVRFDVTYFNRRNISSGSSIFSGKRMILFGLSVGLDLLLLRGDD